MTNRYQRCAADDCQLLSLNDPHCVVHREYFEESCEDAPCCGCCDAGRAVMPR
jgi:hypothetical protein